MTNTAIVIIFAMCLFYFAGITVWNRKFFLSIIFLIPLAEKTIGIGSFSVSFVSAIMLSFYLGCSINKSTENVTVNKELFPFYTVVIVFTSISFIKYTYLGIPSSLDILPMSENDNISNYLTTSASGLILVSIIYSNATDVFIEKCSNYFVGSIYFLLIIYALIKIGLPIPDAIGPVVYLQENSNITGGIEAVSLQSESLFSGFHGHVENFAEYLNLVIILAFLSYCGTSRTLKQRLIFLSVCAISSLFGIISGNKSFLILSSLFILIYNFLILIKNKKLHAIQLLFLVVIFSACFVLFYNLDRFDNFYLVSRFQTIPDRFAETSNGGWVEKMFTIIGRADILTDFWNVVVTGGLFGVAPMVFWKINNSVMPYHNLYYQLILSYGIVGFFAFAFLVLSVLVKLYKIIIAASPLESQKAIILFSLLVCILLNQMKVSSFRISTAQLTLWLVYGICLSYAKLHNYQTKKVK